MSRFAALPVGAASSTGALGALSESDFDVDWAVASLVRECWGAGWPAQTDETLDLAQVVLSDLGEMDALKELRFLVQNG